MEFVATTHYHWSNFDGNATQKGKHEIVQGPFQFGLADKLDKTNKEVSVKIIQYHIKLCYLLRISSTMGSNPIESSIIIFKLVQYNAIYNYIA